MPSRTQARPTTHAAPSGWGGRHRARLHRHNSGLAHNKEPLACCANALSGFLERNPRASLTGDGPTRRTTPRHGASTPAAIPTVGSLQGRPRTAGAWYLLRIAPRPQPPPARAAPASCGKIRAGDSCVQRGLTTADAQPHAPGGVGGGSRSDRWGQVARAEVWPWLDAMGRQQGSLKERLERFLRSKVSGPENASCRERLTTDPRGERPSRPRKRRAAGRFLSLQDRELSEICSLSEVPAA